MVIAMEKYKGRDVFTPWCTWKIERSHLGIHARSHWSTDTTSHLLRMGITFTRSLEVPIREPSNSPLLSKATLQRLGSTKRCSYCLCATPAGSCCAHSMTVMFELRQSLSRPHGLQACYDGFKAGPLRGRVGQALLRERPVGLRGVRGELQGLALHNNAVHDLRMLHAGPGSAASHHLPQQHSKCIHIAGLRRRRAVSELADAGRGQASPGLIAG